MRALLPKPEGYVEPSAHPVANAARGVKALHPGRPWVPVAEGGRPRQPKKD